MRTELLLCLAFGGLILGGMAWNHDHHQLRNEVVTQQMKFVEQQQMFEKVLRTSVNDKKIKVCFGPNGTECYNFLLVEPKQKKGKKK